MPTRDRIVSGIQQFYREALRQVGHEPNNLLGSEISSDFSEAVDWTTTALERKWKGKISRCQALHAEVRPGGLIHEHAS